MAAVLIAFAQAHPAQAAVDPTTKLLPGQYLWDEADAPDAPVSIMVRLDEQLLYVWRGERLIGMSSVSTGMRGKATPMGEFRILQKNVRHRSNIYSNAPMPFMQRLTWDGIALHAGELPGYPASHGCIRLPMAFARQLFSLTDLGHVVSVSGDQSGPYLRIETDIAALDSGDAAPAAPRQALAATPRPLVVLVSSAPRLERIAPPIRAMAIRLPPPQPRLAVDVRGMADDDVAQGKAPGQPHWTVPYYTQ